MNRYFIVVPERPAGWREGRIIPLLEAEALQSIAALSSAGCLADMVSEESFLRGNGRKNDLIILPGSSVVLRTRIEERLASTGGRLLVANDHGGGGSQRAVWRTRKLVGVSSGFQLDLLPSGRHARRRRRHLLAGVRPFTALRPEEGEEVVARWGHDGPAALVVRGREKLKSWRSGFPLDHLDSPGLMRMLEVLEGGGITEMHISPSVPGRGRAVVLLLHDVEEPLPGDSRGVESVVAGIEACLEAERRHGFSATYNLVGRFGDKIPRLIQRIIEEGHEIASHGATHRVMADLDPEALCKDLIESEECIERICGCRVRGFRSPRSRWSVELLDCLAARGYRWNAEVDDSPYPYHVPRESASSLLRIPVAVDDWDFVRRDSSPRQVLATWMEEVSWAAERRCWVGVGSHPSVLGIDPRRTAMFSDFLAWLATENVVVMSHAEAAEWWQSRFSGTGVEIREPGVRFPQGTT